MIDDDDPPLESGDLSSPFYVVFGTDALERVQFVTEQPGSGGARVVVVCIHGTSDLANNDRRLREHTEPMVLKVNAPSSRHNSATGRPAADLERLVFSGALATYAGYSMIRGKVAYAFDIVPTR